jgi:hypothetical protein
MTIRASHDQATAMESELQQIAAQREKLGDTLSTQEVLAQQVRKR